MDFWDAEIRRNSYWPFDGRSLENLGGQPLAHRLPTERQPHRRGADGSALVLGVSYFWVKKSDQKWFDQTFGYVVAFF